MNKTTSRTIALAGVFQAATLVSELASTGKIENKLALKASIDSLFEINASDINSVYGNIFNLQLGLSQFKKIFGFKISKSNELNHILRYVFSLLVLARKLEKKPQYSQTIVKHIQQAKIQTQHFPPLHENILANFADAYVKTFGTLSRRIQIVGHAQYLQNKQVLNTVRSLLLAGIRSGVLWQQNGGSLLQLVLTKRKTIKIAEQILKQYAA